MSPITFKQQVEQLVTELSRCIQLCHDIRTNRNLGSRHENLDRLQSTLEAAETSIPMAYNSTRRIAGRQFEIGDEAARTEMDRHVTSVQTVIKPKLYSIAHPAQHRSRHHGQQQQPGFRTILMDWKALYQEISFSMVSLSRRIEATAASAEFPAKEPIVRSATPPAPLRKTDNITISLREFDHLLRHLKNSWEEVMVEGRVRYVNVHDPKVTRVEKPVGGFVKMMTRPTTPRLARAGSFERRSPGSRESFSLYE